MNILFYILYVIGGLVYYLSLRRSKIDVASLFGFKLIPFRLLLIGEIIWISLWLIGLMFYRNVVSYCLGIIPIVWFLITVGSFSSLIIKNYIARKHSTKMGNTLVLPIIQNWAKHLPKSYRVNSTNASIQEYGQILNGRVIVFISGENNNELQWEYYGDLLKHEINQPVIMEIRLNDEIVYPIWK